VLQRSARGPEAINQGWRHHLGNFLYGLSRWLAGPQVQHAYHEHIAQLTEAILNVADDNPGSRILVVTNIQYCHHIRPRLRQRAGTVVQTITDL